MTTPKLKRYALHWEATIHGVQIVEAFDEDDACDQFDGIIHEDGLPDEPIHATLDYCAPVVSKRKKRKSG